MANVMISGFWILTCGGSEAIVRYMTKIKQAGLRLDMVFLDGYLLGHAILTFGSRKGFRIFLLLGHAAFCKNFSYFWVNQFFGNKFLHFRSRKGFRIFLLLGHAAFCKNFSYFWVNQAQHENSSRLSVTRHKSP
jgi:hypothetical protein